MGDWEKLTPDGVSASPIGAAAGNLYHIMVSAAGATTRIMPLGDSITKGASSGVVPDEEQYYVSYRKELWDKLTAAGYEVDFVGSQQSGGAADPDFDPDHEGHGGKRDDWIADRLDGWLTDYQPDVVLLHIGTVGLDPSPDDVEDILDGIDDYSLDTWVVLARIINRSDHVCPNINDTTVFNNNVESMAQDRIDDPANPAYPDKIKIVDMECGAGIVYRLKDDGGDMWDHYHPYETGYAKMADMWFSKLKQILPLPLELTSTVKNIKALRVVVPDDGFILCRASGTIRHMNLITDRQILCKLYLTRTSGGAAPAFTYSGVSGITFAGNGGIAFPFAIERCFSESGRIDRNYYLTGEEDGSGVNTATTYVQGVNMTCQYHPYSF